MSSPENASAEQYDACKPSRSIVHIAPASRLMQRPIADAATTMPGFAATQASPAYRR